MHALGGGPGVCGGWGRGGSSNVRRGRGGSPGAGRGRGGSPDVRRGRGGSPVVRRGRGGGPFGGGRRGRGTREGQRGCGPPHGNRAATSRGALGGVRVGPALCRPASA